MLITHTLTVHVDLRKIAIVTAILDRSPNHKTVSRFVRTALARAGEPLSINTLASKLIHSSSINNQPWLIQKVETLAREGNSWKAMVLYGMILLEKGQPDEAANWYQSAMNAVKPIETPSSLQTILNAVALVKSPFEAYAELKLKLEQVDEARKAAEVGVSQYNNSGCHKLLASILSSNNQDHDKAEGHLMKSAMSRDPNACHVLGQIYRLKHLGLKQAENDPFYQVLFASRKISPGLILDRSPYISTAEYYRMAKEWLELAAYEGVAMASLQMAILLRQENKLQDGLAYLDRVGDDSKYTQVVANLREIWTTPDADTSSILLASHQL
ncbi:hypothetical protein LOZ61_004477 [Ophidiomyces ophidiicola]|uniref:Uncharacterized protein n=1 Tax=Ophidiomyces ophidiicola TaxID=1387563 RepID=A0ACB8V6U0_9EURO|nr:hypothetical protein LOZ61_004477 [Ophidiomyces ophidiicola]KAI1925625.1 hypothetical protein LOZ60_004044 [Ophidiomyces ophidiicola]KAI2131881.1 hypothetical protein LOZ31_000246 [Ophidiomyces ophidiicola]KAI2148044.1 hypothetical protein LOZ27_002072 [Ophidiomyces ophidiicola]KAI2393445.1 hypothetical protein LOY88_000043 [Ophidiomyces ophidiicola]